MYQLEIRSRAVHMMQDAFEWYEKEKIGLGDAFYSDLNLAFKKLQEHPKYYTKTNKQFRQLRLKRFPFVIVFEIIEFKVVVFAVLHTSRNDNKKFQNRIR